MIARIREQLEQQRKQDHDIDVAVLLVEKGDDEEHFHLVSNREEENEIPLT